MKRVIWRRVTRHTASHSLIVSVAKNGYYIIYVYIKSEWISAKQKIIIINILKQRTNTNQINVLGREECLYVALEITTTNSIVIINIVMKIIIVNIIFNSKERLNSFGLSKVKCDEINS